MKVYAIINGVLDNNGYTMLNKSGVKDKNYIFHFSRMGELMERVEIGDKVIVITIGSFVSVSNLSYILNMFISKGVTFLSFNERIKFSSKNPMRPQYKEYITNVLKGEQAMISRLQQSYRHVDRTDMFRKINMFSLGMVIETFKNDGILQK